MDLLSRWRSRQNRHAFRKTKAEAGEDQMVCGTVLPSGKPVYFSMPRSATDTEIEAKAFEVRNGRGLLPGDTVLRELAAKRMSTA